MNKIRFIKSCLLFLFSSSLLLGQSKEHHHTPHVSGMIATNLLTMGGNLQSQYLKKEEGANVLSKLLDKAFLEQPDWDAGKSSCTHKECTGGVDAKHILDTQPKYANSKIPWSRVADCPSGYTNNGLTCGRGAHSISAPSRVANCPSGYTNMGASCFRGASTHSDGCFSSNCRSGYTDMGCFCARGASSKGMSSMSCPSGYFRTGGRCYKNCPSGYTNMGETCFRGVSTKGIGSMTCKPNEKKEGPRCFKKQICPSNREYYGGLCYKKCPDGSERTAVSTCRHTIKLSGNTHLWVINRGLDLLKKSTDPIAKKAVKRMNTASCRTKWEQGLWDGDGDELKDVPTSSRRGSHFYNGAGKDAWGKPSSVKTYFLAGVDVTANVDGTFQPNARESANARINRINNINSDDGCYQLGLALHYLSDMTQPMHSTGFSGVSIPTMLHPMFEFYVPSVQARYPAPRVWDERWKGLSPDVTFHNAAVKSSSLSPDLMKSLEWDGTICTMSYSSDITYTGFCFIRVPKVDKQIGKVLTDGYQSAASYIYNVFKSI